MSVLADLERILRTAQAQVRALERPDHDALDAVLVELGVLQLETVLSVVQAAVAVEGANFEAPEEPPASTH